MVCAINNYIKNTPANAPFFKGVVMVPVVGQIVQIWKRITLANEYAAADPNDVNCPRAFKKVEIKRFNEQSYHFGKWGDIALIGSGVGFISIAPLAGQLLIAAGCFSLFARRFSVVFGM